MEHFFFPNSSGDLRSGAHQSQIIGGDADVDHTQIIGGYAVKLLGGIYSGVAATWRFWLCARGGRLLGGGKMRLHSAHSK